MRYLHALLILSVAFITASLHAQECVAPSVSVEVHGPLPTQTKGQQYYTYTVTHDANRLDITWRVSKTILGPTRPLNDSLDSSCMNGSQTLRVVGTSSCGAQSSSQQSVAPLDTTPVITVRPIPKTNPVYTLFQIGFFFPAGGGHVSGHFLPGAGGVQHFLGKLAGPQVVQVDEAAIRDRLKALADHDDRAAGELRKAYQELDEILDLRQQARFRLFEELIERRKIDLLKRAQQGAAARQRRQ